MDWNWKEELAKISLGGIVIFVAGHAYKFIKKGSKPAKNWAISIWNINKTKTDAQYSLELWKANMYFSNKPMYIMNIKGEFEWANPAWCNLVGFEDEEDAHFMGWMRCIPDEDVESMRQQNKDFAEHPNNSEGQITLINIRTKIPFDVKFVNKLLYDENKKPFKSLGILEIIK